MAIFHVRSEARRLPPPEWLAGGGTLGQLIRDLDWSASPLGPRSDWPQSLRTTIGLVVANRFPMALLWGRELSVLYNDAYSRVLGSHHPAALGRPAREVWPEVWPISEPIFDRVVTRGETIYREDQSSPIECDGRLEDAYFTLCYSPVRVEDGTVGGMLLLLEDTTARITERRRSESALNATAIELERTADRLRLAQQVAGVGLFDWNIVDDEVEWSPEIAALYGLPPVTRRTPRSDWVRRVHPDDVEEVEARVRESLETGALEAECRVVRPDGTERWIALRARVYRDFEGCPVRMMGLNIDVTEEKRTQQELRAARDYAERSSQLLRALSDSTPDRLFAKDTRGRMVFANPATLRAIGKPAEQVLGLSEAEWLGDPEQAAVIMENDRRIMRTGETEDVVETMRTPEGDRVLHAVKSPLLMPDGTIGGIVGMSRDITASKATEHALRESEALFRSVFEQSAVGLARVGLADGCWIDVNEAFCRMLGRTRDELLALTWTDLAHPEDVQRDEGSFRRLGAGDIETYTAECRFTDRGGQLVWATVALSLVRDADERPAFAIAVIENITDRKRTELALVEANRRLVEADQRKNEFLGMLSHELRNPMAPIFNSLFILEHAGSESEPARRARAVLARQVGHMSRLIDDLLDVTRIARGKIEIRRTDVDLGQVMAALCDDYRTLMEERQLDLVCEAAPSLHVRGDETRLGQVIGNLVQNAAKFTPAGGRVMLSLAAEDDQAVVRVRDSGPGIAPALLPHVFEPFTQGEQDLARSEGGLGLGLAFVRGLVELHGGTVTAANRTDGTGAEFTVRVPLTSP